MDKTNFTYNNVNFFLILLLDPLLEEKLRCQLEMVKEAGEMGEFVSASPTPDNQPTTATIHSPPTAASPAPSVSTTPTIHSPPTQATAASPAPSLSTTPSASQDEISSNVNETSTNASTSTSTSTSTNLSTYQVVGMKTKKKSFCHLPEDDIKNKELFIWKKMEGKEHYAYRKVHTTIELQINVF